MQGTEAACQKFSEIYFDREARKMGLMEYTNRPDIFDYKAGRILSYHDEFTVECDEDVVDDVKRLMYKAYEEASNAMWDWHKKYSKWFKGSDLPTFAIQLQSGSAVGDDYFSVH